MILRSWSIILYHSFEYDVRITQTSQHGTMHDKFRYKGRYCHTTTSSPLDFLFTRVSSLSLLVRSYSLNIFGYILGSGIQVLKQYACAVFSNDSRSEFYGSMKEIFFSISLCHAEHTHYVLTMPSRNAWKPLLSKEVQAHLIRPEYCPSKV